MLYALLIWEKLGKSGSKFRLVQYLEFHLRIKRRQLWTTTQFKLSYPGLKQCHLLYNLIADLGAICP